MGVKLVNEAANTYFIGNAQLLRKLEALESSLSHNAKIVIPSGCELVNVIGEMAGVLPLAGGNGRRRAEDRKHGLTESGQVAQRVVKPSVMREEVRS